MKIYFIIQCVARVVTTLVISTALGTSQGVLAQYVHVTGVEHIGMNVPDANKAVMFFHEVFGFTAVTELGPYNMDEEFRSKYRVHRSASLPHVVMMRAGDGPNLEIFQFDSAEGSKAQPYFDDLGATHIAFYTDNINASVALLRARGIEVLTDPIVNESGPTSGETWFYFKTPWGSSIELVSYPHGETYEKREGAIPLWHPGRLQASSAALDIYAQAYDPQGLATRLIAIINNRDKSKRLAAITDIYSQECKTVQKDSVLVGQKALSDFITSLQHQHPAWFFRQAGRVSADAVSLRVRWRFSPRGSTHPRAGQGVFFLKEGKISESILF